MEKIYEKEQKKKYKKFQSMRLDSVSCLLFGLALILVAGFTIAGLTNSSYAADTPITVTSDLTYVSGNNDSFPNRFVQGQDNGYIYCIERFVGSLGPSYTSDGIIDDAGLSYLLNVFDLSNPNKIDTSKISIINNLIGTSDRQITEMDVKYWAGQAAIYVYLNGTTNNIPTEFINSANLANYHTVVADNNEVSTVDLEDPDFAEDIQDVLNQSNYFRASNGGVIFSEILADNGKNINQIVDKAKQLKESGGNLFELSIVREGEGIKADGKYYLSGPYKAIIRKNSYYTNEPDVKLSIEGAPSGTTIVGKDGKEIKNSTANTEFYVKIPKDKVRKATTIKILGTTDVEYNVATKYVAESGQALAALSPASNEISAGDEFSIAPTKDTGISVGQTIYFIGLIVLLCGVGIIYANAKPAQAQE